MAGRTIREREVAAEDAREEETAAHKRRGRGFFADKERDQDGVEDGFEQGDKTCLRRAYESKPAREEDIRDRHLESPERGKDGHLEQVRVRTKSAK